VEEGRFHHSQAYVRPTPQHFPFPRFHFTADGRMQHPVQEIRVRGGPERSLRQPVPKDFTIRTQNRFTEPSNQAGLEGRAPQQVMP
jgi:hypothetical protein